MEEARVAYNKGQIEYRDYQQTVEAKKGAEARLQAEQAQLDRLRAGATEEKLRQLRANIDEIEAQLAQAEVSLERTELVSPINGTVLERPVEQGTVIQPGSPIAVIGDTETLEVESYVLAEDSIRVEPGQEVRITGDVLSAALPGIVKSVSSVAVTRQSELGVLQERVRVIIAPEDSTPLKPGYGVDVHIVVNAVDEALTVPAETVFHEGEHDFVFVVSGEKVSRRQVTVGVKQQSVFQLTEGLEQGELVVRNPSEELSDGDTVRVE
jgi:HlyD family secretion protein